MPVPTSPGVFFYTDAMPGAAPEALLVVRDGDALSAVFESPEDGRVLIPVEQMAGEFQAQQ